MLHFKHPFIWTLILLTKSRNVQSWIPVDDYEDISSELLEQEGLAPTSEDVGPRCFLTEVMEDPRWKSDSVYVWREQAKVHNLQINNTEGEVESYSGFLTVNKQYNSNIFFWFFPASIEVEKAPLILWLNGGPGSSSLFGLFVEHGPYKVNNEGVLEKREFPWTLTNSVIYMDSPVGTGFSYTDKPRGYAKNQKDVSRDLYEALSQFYRVFPEFTGRDLYIAGESYAGKYVPSLGYKIHIENQNDFNNVHINLKGIIIGSGFSDPLSQNEYGDYLYHLGLIDGGQRTLFLEEEDRIRKLIEAEDWPDATEAVQSLILVHPKRASFFHNVTGFSFYMNLLETVTPQDYKNYVRFINTNRVRRSIHVGDQPFSRGKPTVVQNLLPDICKSVKPEMEKLLEENYRVLIYAPQLDIIVPHTGIDRFVNSLDWSGAKAYSKARRRAWRVNGEIAGYTKFARNLAHVFMRNAGHVAPYDQPAWSFDMINRFTKGKAF